MSEMKRVAFTTLSTDLSATRRASTGNFCAAALFEDNEATMLPPCVGGSVAGLASSSVGVTSQAHGPKTLRLKLELFDPNIKSFPEFNYSKLIHVEKKKLKKISKSNGFLDVLEENDDDVARIAKEFEKKYSGSYATKGRRNKKDDYYDKGAGYDESDSFIDNTEAYDEIIPEEVETVGGGFYINSGALEFTHNVDDETIKIVKTKKRALSSSSSSEAEDGAKRNGKNHDEVKEPVKDLPAKENSANGKVDNVHHEKKLKIAEDLVDHVSKMTKHHKDKKMERVKTKDGDSEAYSDSGTEKEKEKDKEKFIKTTTVKDMLKAKRDNFRKMQQEEDAVKGHVMNGERDSDSEGSSDTATESEVEIEPKDKKRRKSMDTEDGEKMRTSDVKLPDILPESVLQDVEGLKVVVRESNQAGKPLHFTERMIEIFFRIDDACSCLDKTVRNQIFAHLEYQLSLPKYYFLRKARTLRIKQERNKTKRSYLKLKNAVAEVMPSVLINYETNCRKVDELRAIASQNNIDNVELPKYPKKRFLWDDTIRNLLFELYQVRWTSYLVLRTRKESLSDFITNYIKEKVVPIWPQGWIKYEELKKELEKRKKPKDNKRSDEEESSSKRNVDVDKLPSILSNNSNVSIISTKDLVVTISTKSDKKTEVPLSSSDTLTVTPISTDGGNISKNGSASKVADGLQQKSHKQNSSAASSSLLVISPNSVPRTTSPLNLHQTSGHSKTANSSHTNHGSNRQSGENKNTNLSINTSGSRESSQGTSNKQQTAVTLDLSSPLKRATDHSINSIMSSSSRTTPSPTNHSSISSKVPAVDSDAQSMTGMKNSAGASSSTSSSDTAITHVITVDNLKNTSDIINTSNKLINNNTSNSNTGSNSNATSLLVSSGSNGTIRIRSVASVNSCLEKEKERRKDSVSSSDHLRPSSRASTIEDVNIVSESDSDGVEIVGVFPVSNKKKKHSVIPGLTPSASTTIRTGSKHKDKKLISQNSRSSSPKIANSLLVQNLKREHGSSSSKSLTVNSRYNDLEHSGKEKKRVTAAEQPATSTATASDKDSELDVYQIMQALKELEEMQQSNIHISSTKSPTNKRQGGGSHPSPINYI